jgi:hypothetical protein
MYVLLSHRLRELANDTHTHRTTDGPDRPDRCCTAHTYHIGQAYPHMWVTNFSESPHP